MSSLVKLVRYEDKKAEALTYIDGLIRHVCKKTDKGDIGLYKLISYHIKKTVEDLYIEDEKERAEYHLITATALSFLYGMLCPGDLIDKDINDDECVKKLTNGENLTDDDYQYLVAFYETRAVKAVYEKNISKFEEYRKKSNDLAIKWILNPTKETESK